MPTSERTPDAGDLPGTGGTYVLLLRLDLPAHLKIGRLGAFDFAPGWYAYVGSALGPGGLRARLSHHQKRAARPHWHIDYLRQAANLEWVWYAVGGDRHEHAWAAALGSLPGASLAARRFGASDCDCPAHLFHYAHMPHAAAFGDRIAPTSIRRWQPSPA